MKKYRCFDIVFAVISLPVYYLCRMLGILTYTFYIGFKEGWEAWSDDSGIKEKLCT